MSTLNAIVLTLLLAQTQRPSAPANIGLRDAAPASTVSSGEDAYITWTVDPTTIGMAYDISLDDGPWTPVAPADLQEVPRDWWDINGTNPRMYAVNRGKWTLGPHTIQVRECDAARTTCAPSAVSTVTVVLPVACVMGEWSPWTDWTGWKRAGGVETRYHTRYRAITTQPGVGAAPCPTNTETVPDTRPYVPPPLDPVSVTYVRMDATTKGAWIGRYGAQGQAFAGGAAVTLPFVTVTPVGASFYAWSPSTTDDRGLQRPGAPSTDRIAATWYAADVFDLDVRFTDTQMHEVALYAVDWDAKARAQRIEVLDSQDTVRHSVTTGPELASGVYYVWQISGHARIRVTRTAGANGVVFGLLFGSSAGMVAK